MKGVLYKDLILIRNSLSFVYLFPLAVILIGAGSNVVFLAAIAELTVPLFMAFLLYNAMCADENSHWKRYEVGLPLSRVKVLQEKYVLGGALALVAALIDVVLAFVFVLFGVSVPYVAGFVVLGTAIGIVYVVVLIPSVLRFGTSKGSVVFIGCIGVIMLAPFALNSFGLLESALSILMDPLLLAAVSFAVCALVAACSYAISLRIQRRAEQ